MDSIEGEEVKMKSNENMSNQESTNKVLLDPSIPIEELLGSVTTYNNVDGAEMKSLQLRTSARVFKKMKLDSALAALPVEKKEPEKKEETKPEVKKTFSQPLWTDEEKNLFFEALNEYGKDFDAIRLHILTKLKKRGIPENTIKTKEQVRHLYYRTWHKISKYLKFSDDVKKIAQELYGLINYGELRKKLTCISAKTSIKLNELIYRGCLAIRVKGKNIRIKTPMCKALRQLNQLDEKIDDIKLPPRITIELKPKDMSTWMHVQEMSQNPRVKCVIPLQKRLSTLIGCMSERWKSQETVEHEKLLLAAEQLSNTDGDILDNTKPKSDPPLRFSPPTGCTITVPTINITEFYTTQSICMNAYEERVGVKTSGEKLWLDTYPNYFKGYKKGVKRVRVESESDKSFTTPKAGSSTAIDNNENCLTDADYSISKVDEYIDEAVNTILALQNQEPMEVVEEKSEAVKFEEDCLLQVKKEHDIAKIKSGWILSECGTLTVGDLYLMYGSDSKITLEYSWDVVETLHLKKEVDLLDEVVKSSVLEQDNTDNCNNYENTSDSSNALSGILRKFLSVVKLHYRKNIVKCPCGHICGKSSNFRNKCTMKPIKLDNKQLLDSQLSTSTIVSVPSNITTTASMVPLILQPQIRKFSPSLFRRPISPNDGLTLRAQIDSIQRLPRYCKRGRRPRSKQVVVERKLPILANKADSGRQIVQMNIISQEVVPRQIAPKVVPQITSIASSLSANGIDQNSTYMETTLTSLSVTSDETTGAFTILNDNIGTNMENNIIPEASTSTSRVGSPTSISNLLDMALLSHENNVQNDIKLKDESNGINFVGLLSENMSASTPPSSPSRILKENENQWLNSEVADFSLSSFLGHLESPLKNVQSNSNMTNDDTRLCLSQDVDIQLHSLLTETSLDYTAKFADLAAQVNKK